jgi:hypothetical protein
MLVYVVTPCMFLSGLEWPTCGLIFDGLFALLAACFLFVPCLANFHALKMEGIYSSETSGFFQAARLYNPREGTLHSHSFETHRTQHDLRMSESKVLGRTVGCTGMKLGKAGGCIMRSFVICTPN